MNTDHVLNRRVLLFLSTALACLAGTGGCGQNGRAPLTPGARLVAAGSGTVEYTAPRKGAVYVVDTRTNELVGVGDLEAGQAVRVDAASNQVTMGGKVVNQRPVSGNRRYEIRFRPDDEPIQE